MSFTRIVQIVYIFVRAILADLRLAPAAVSRAYLERRVPLIERTLVDKGSRSRSSRSSTAGGCART